jgi:hypothetical protein
MPLGGKFGDVGARCDGAHVCEPPLGLGPPRPAQRRGLRTPGGTLDARPCRKNARPRQRPEVRVLHGSMEEEANGGAAPALSCRER